MYGKNNIKVLTEIEALIEKVQFGKLKVEFDVHDKNITGIEVEGHKRTKYKKDNFKAFEDIARRIKLSTDKKDTTKIMFLVDVKAGFVDQTIWLTTIRRNYKLEDST